MAEHSAVFADTRLSESKFVFFARIIALKRRGEFKKPVTAIEFIDCRLHRDFAFFFTRNTGHYRPTLRIYPYFGAFIPVFAEFHAIVGNSPDVTVFIPEFVVEYFRLFFDNFIVLRIISARNFAYFFHISASKHEHLRHEYAFALAFFAYVGKHIVPVGAEHKRNSVFADMRKRIIYRFFEMFENRTFAAVVVFHFVVQYVRFAFFADNLINGVHHPEVIIASVADDRFSFFYRVKIMIGLSAIILLRHYEFDFFFRKIYIAVNNA
ncbi:unknown [Acidiphilium sp. CAG:727]|nr:unknown [Acidiphilium sp. CAG:727]